MSPRSSFSLASIYDVFSSIRTSCCVIFHLWALKASEIYCLIYLVRILVRFSGARFLRRHLCTLAKTLDSTVQSDKGTINVLIRIYKSYRFDKTNKYWRRRMVKMFSNPQILLSICVNRCTPWRVISVILVTKLFNSNALISSVVELFSGAFR